MPKSPIGPIPGQKIGAVGMSWFHEADYTAALAIMADTELPPTYALFLERASQRKRQATRDGHVVIRAVIDPKTFPMWCAARGFTRIDANARKRFAAEFAANQIGL